jgi:hypothetical protein
METLGNKFADKSTKFFYCEICDYKTCHKGHYNEHLNSLKHSKRQQMETYGNKIDDKTANTQPIINHICSYKQQYTCANCNQIYKNRSGLWKHNKICSLITSQPEEKKINTIDKDDVILMVLKQNAELLEIVKNGTHNTTNNTTHTNSHNKAFNLNFFLNETCKNAMNITDFVDSIKLQLSDFMDVGEAGYIQGISNIIVKKLNDLDETVRPIHCTDQKRETFYVKDENKWEKEEEDFKRIRKMIKKVAYKNERLMTSYKEKYPDYNDPDSKRSDQYSKTVIEALGGDGENYKEKENKIIRNISRATQITRK